MADSYLGCIYNHSKHGEGVVVFEEDSNPEAWRLLLIAFPESTQEVIPERLAEHGYRPLRRRVSLPSAYRRLPGHDDIRGWAYDIQAAREALRGERVAA